MTNFKRFTQLSISNIPKEAKLILVAGPNGSGKSSVFDAFHQWYKGHSGFGYNTDLLYYQKDKSKAYNRNNSVDVKFHDSPSGSTFNKNAMYFRTAYRNDPDFQVSSFGRVGDPSSQLRFQRFIENDQTVSINYQRLIHRTLAGVYSEANDDKNVKQLRHELIGRVRESMLNVFDDLVLNNIGDPLDDGSFFFKKGEIDSFHYKNLSGGEKAAFDLLLDLILKIDHYSDAVLFIDEPETHMHTSLQGKLIGEIYRILPEDCQLWMTTHSLGVMRKAKEILALDSDGVAFLDFGEVDFDHAVELKPVSVDSLMWEKFLSISIGDLSEALAPTHIVMCEGDINGKGRRNFDAYLYEKIFKGKYPELVFVSGGASSELEKKENISHGILSQVLPATKIVRLIDRDDKSDEEAENLERNRIYCTSRRHIESYLFDDELIKKLVIEKYSPSLVTEPNMTDDEKINTLITLALKEKRNAVEDSISRGNAVDDVKSASGQIYNSLKRILQLTQCGNTADAFMKDTMADLITPDTAVYKEFEEQCIKKILA